MTLEDPPVLLNERGRVGHIRLNRPAKINALTAPMIAAVRDALSRWAADPQIIGVVIDGAGERGLCAGGDIAAFYDGIRGESAPPEGFWADEYRMNLAIAEYPKPVLSLMYGITFGGGVGISAHAAIRAVTDTTKVAMPETGIGLAPDVGGLYLLARAPGELGSYAALTGARLGPADAIIAGLADFYVTAADFGVLADRVAAAEAADMAAIVRSAAAPVPPSEFYLANRDWIDTAFAGDDALAILTRLLAHDDPAARAAGEILASRSPIAVAVTLRALRRAATMTLAEVLDQDLMLSIRFAAHPDLAEGIRAQIIDKDRHPRWSPATLAEVSAAEVDAFFA